jgi:formylglycine-generating enzyme required for sulfatase activity
MVAHIVGKEMSQEKTNVEKLDKEEDFRSVLRGGCWGDRAYSLEVSGRGGSSHTFADKDLGFRLVLQTKEKK